MGLLHRSVTSRTPGPSFDLKNRCDIRGLHEAATLYGLVNDRRDFWVSVARDLGGDKGGSLICIKGVGSETGLFGTVILGKS